MILDKLFGKSEEKSGPDIAFIVENFRRRADRLVAASDIEELRELFAKHAADASMQWPGYACNRLLDDPRFFQGGGPRGGLLGGDPAGGGK